MISSSVPVIALASSTTNDHRHPTLSSHCCAFEIVPKTTGSPTSFPGVNSAAARAGRPPYFSVVYSDKGCGLP